MEKTMETITIDDIGTTMWFHSFILANQRPDCGPLSVIGSITAPNIQGYHKGTPSLGTTLITNLLDTFPNWV